MTMTLTGLLDYLSGEIICLTVDKAPCFPVRIRIGQD